MWHEFNTKEQYLDALVDTISVRLNAAIAKHGSAGLAVSGGRSPIPLFGRLSQADINWDCVRVSLVDERFVAPDHPDSNEHLVRRHLLVNRAGAAKFTGLVSNSADVDASVATANKQKESITLAILGMGDNGHMASLLPGAAQLHDALSPACTQRYIRITPPVADYERISMTLTALLQTGALVLAIAGEQKKETYQKAAQQVTATLPVSYLIAQAETPFDAYWHP